MTTNSKMTHVIIGQNDRGNLRELMLILLKHKEQAQKIKGVVK